MKRMLAMTCEMANDADGPHSCAYRQGYGLEMTFDDEWPYETIFLVPPYLLEGVTSDVDLESANACAGVSSVPGDGNFSRIADAKGKWMLAWPTEPLDQILESGIGCILYADTLDALSNVSIPTTATKSNFAVALQTSSITDKNDADSMLASAKELLKARDIRFILSIGIEHNDEAPMLAKHSESDGSIFLNVFPGAVAQFVNEHLEK